MIKREITVVLISTAVGIGVVAIVSFFIVWIGFPAENPKDSFRDALSFAGGLFGGLATFGAAIIAAYLFNDWRIIHNKNIDVAFINNIIKNFEDFDLMLTRQYIPIQDLYYQSQDSKSPVDSEAYKLTYENLCNNLSELRLCFLILTKSIQTLAIVHDDFIETVDSLKSYKSEFRKFRKKIIKTGFQDTPPNILTILHAFDDFQKSLSKLERNFIRKYTASLKEN